MIGVIASDDFECLTLELPWKNNQPQISCIPPGQYALASEMHARFGFVYRVKDVPGRSGILIHSGNTVDDIKGCIVPGFSLSRISGKTAVLESRRALVRLTALAANSLIVHA